MTNLTGANLGGANLGGANLTGVTWSNTTCPDGTVTTTGEPTASSRGIRIRAARGLEIPLHGSCDEDIKG